MVGAYQWVKRGPNSSRHVINIIGWVLNTKPSPGYSNDRDPFFVVQNVNGGNSNYFGY